MQAVGSESGLLRIRQNRGQVQAEARISQEGQNGQSRKNTGKG